MKQFSFATIFLLLIASCNKSSPSNPAIATVPIISTTAINSITSTTAISGGNITSDGTSNIVARGVCWNTTGNPTTTNSKTTDGSDKGSFTSSLSGLNANTTYYVRAYATNAVGTSYGDQIIFKTISSGTVIPGALTICSLVWMDKNLNVSTYRNGDSIPLVTDPGEWAALTTGAYCYRNNDPASEALYGKMYNGYAVRDPRGLAPIGWHIASDIEWHALTTCLGNYEVAGGALKQVGTSLWASPNIGATNSSGFTATPCGIRLDTGFFNDITGTHSYWWTATASYPPNSTTHILGRVIYNYESFIYVTAKINSAGMAVRCVKD